MRVAQAGEMVSLPHDGKAGCTWSRRKEGEEVRLQGFPGSLSLLRSWRMRQEGPAFSWLSGAQQPSLHPLPKKHSPPAGGNETAGSRELPSPPNQCARGGGQARRRKGSPLPSTHLYTSSTHIEVSSQGPFTYQLSSTHQALKVCDSAAPFPQWLG